jgi:hypothetical protein
MNLAKIAQLVQAEATAEHVWSTLSDDERRLYREANVATFMETSAPAPKPAATLPPELHEKPKKPAAKPAVKKPAAKPAVKPAAKNPTKPVAPVEHPKKTFNKAVHAHFAAGRKLSAEHRKAISEGLKRYHAANGRGSYTMGQRNKAIRHVNKHLQAKADHHLAMHQHYKTRAAEHKRHGNVDTAARMHARAKSHLAKHKLHTNLIKPLFTRSNTPK